MLKTTLISAACTALILSTGLVVSANAANPMMKQCSQQWQAMKTSNTVPAGMKWNDYLKTCSATAAKAAVPVPGSAVPAAKVATAPPPAAKPAATQVATAPAIVQPAAPASKGSSRKLKKAAVSAAPAAVAPAAAGTVVATGGKAGEQVRIRQCAAEWKADKAGGTLPAGATWTAFWSACDARLKTNG